MPKSRKKLRREGYPSIGDQLGAVFDYLNQERLNGKNLPASCDHVLGKILAVKKKHPQKKKKKPSAK